MPLDEDGGLRHVEVAGDREHRVAAGVVPVEELLRVGHGRMVEVAEGAVAVVRVRERGEHHRWQPEPRKATVRAVEDVDPDLLLDHVHLVDQVLLRQPGTAHAVGLEEQRPLEGAGRQHLEVVGVVQVGGAVEAAAGALHMPEVGELLEVLRTLEHQVFEEMGEPGATLGFGADADVVDDGHPDDRRTAVGGQNHPQAVVQGESFDRILRRGNLHCARHSENLTRHGRQRPIPPPVPRRTTVLG
jgi:hypothetical protein